MFISDAGIKLLKSFEGFRSHAYRDSVGILTIGYGSTKIAGIPVGEDDMCTVDQAEDYLRTDLQWAEAAVNKNVKVSITQNQFDALVSLVYNIGGTAFSTSTLLRRLNEAKYAEAAEEFLRWNKAGGKPVQGLTNRRVAEKELFLHDS
jgi:lysozyme